MAPAPVGTAGAVVASATSVLNPTTLTPGTGSGYAVGDTLLCFTACRSATPTVATPSGWFSILNVTGTNGRMALFFKRAASTSEAAPSVVWSGLTTGSSGTPVQAVVRAFSGLAAGSIADVVGTVADGAASTATSAGGAAITTLTADDLVLSLTTRLDDAFTTFTAPAGFTNVTAAMGSASGLDFAMGWAYQVKTPAGAVTAPNFGLTGATSFASSGVVVALKPLVTGTPVDETSIDNFDRADGPIYSGVGASLWESVGTYQDNTTASTMVTAGNQLASSSGSTGYYARSKFQLQASFDLLCDIATFNQFFVFFATTDLGTSTWDGYALEISGTGTWILRYYTNGAPSTLVTTSAGPVVVAGSTLWIEKRGTTTSIYYRIAAGGQFAQVFTVTDARNNVASPVVIQVPNTTARLDNLRGGPSIVFAVRTGTDSLGTSDVATRAVQPFTRTASDYLGPLISYNSEIDVDSPVSHWKLGEGGSDSAVDRKGNLNLVNTNQGSTGTSSTVTDLLSNNGGSSASRMQDHQVFTPASTVYTFYDSSLWSYELWFRPNVLANSTPLGKLGATPIRFGVNITGTLTITATDAGGATRFYTSTNQVVVGQVYHAVGTFDGNTLRLYVNGVLWASGSCVGLQDTSRGIAIGNVTNNSNNPDLDLDEVAWYNSQLSLTRIQAHYQVGAGLIPVGTRDSAVRKVATAIVREFDGGDDQIIVSGGSVGQIGQDPFTVLLVIQPLLFFYEYPITIYAANGDFLGGLNLDGGDQTLHWNTSFGSSVSPFAADTSWQILVISKASSGNSTVRFHRAPLGGRWTHGDGGLNSSFSGLADQIVFGSTRTPDLWQYMRLAVAAIWNRGLSDAEIESIKGGTLEIQSVSGGAPVALWEFNQVNPSIPVVDIA